MNQQNIKARINDESVRKLSKDVLSRALPIAMIYSWSSFNANDFGDKFECKFRSL